MRVDENREHAKRSIVFDETHAAHVGRKVVDLSDTFGHRQTGTEATRVGAAIVSSRMQLKPIRKRLDIHSAHVVTRSEHFANQVSPNESSRPGNQKHPNSPSRKFDTNVSGSCKKRRSPIAPMLVTLLGGTQA
jgi:hypothetical protein